MSEDRIFDPRLVSFALALLTVSLTALAQVSLKFGINQTGVHALGASEAPGSFAIGLLKLLCNHYVLIGVAIYVGSTFLWMLVLSRLPLSQAYPFVGLSIMLTTLLGVLWLGERVVPTQIIGIVMVSTGVWLVARNGVA